MERKRYKICGLVCIMIMSLCAAVFCGREVLISVSYGAFFAAVGFCYWFFASRYMPDIECKSWLVLAPYTVLCVVGCLLFGKGFCHIVFFIGSVAVCIDSSVVFCRKEGRPALSVFRLFGISLCACSCIFVAWILISGGVL